MVAIYTRQSVDKKDSISIESQIDFCKHECLNEEYKVYTDRGFSGKNINRPAFSQMIKDIEGGIVHKVIVYKLDRISRSLLDFANIIEQFKSKSVEFNSTQEKFDTSTPMGNAMLSITMVFAQLERETIQQRITDNYYQRGKLGVHLGGEAPYGFSIERSKLNDKKVSCLVANESEILNLIKMFHLYGDDYLSLGEIARRLNDDNVPTKRNSTWNSNRVSMLLRNPVCVKSDADIYNYYSLKGCTITNSIDDFIGVNGSIFYGKRNANTRKYTTMEEQKISIGLHKGEISSELFLRCQYRLDNNTQIKRSGQGSHSWLSGIIKCGKCGYSFTAVKTPKKNIDYFYFRCSGRIQNACSGHSTAHRVEEIEAVVEKELFKIIKIHENLAYQDTVKEANSDNELKIQLSKVDKQIGNLVGQIADGNNVVNQYINDKINELDKEKQIILNKLNQSSMLKPQAKEIKKLINMLESWSERSLEEKKVLVRFFIDKVEVADGKIKIMWKHQFNQKTSKKRIA